MKYFGQLQNWQIYYGSKFSLKYRDKSNIAPLLRSGSGVLTNSSPLSLSWTVFEQVSRGLAVFSNCGHQTDEVQQLDCKLILDLEFLSSFLGRVPSLKLSGHGQHGGGGGLVHLAALAQLTRLQLARVPAHNIGDLVTLRPHLASLGLARCPEVRLGELLTSCLGSCSPSLASSWAQLTVLAMSHCGLTSLSPALQLAPHLTHLDCSHNKITGDTSLVACFAKIPSLEIT